MREQKRIKRICEKLNKVWELVDSDQRLGQLLENYIFDSGKFRGEGTCFLFYQEDDKTEKILDEILSKINQGGKTNGNKK